MPRAYKWTNRSVRRLAGDRDPIVVIEEMARERAIAALDAGWRGPPFNPAVIAKMLDIPIEANASIPDARTVPDGDWVKIQFNPSQPRERLRFSIAHEVAHALFPDVAQEVRNRGGPLLHDDWQLEMLCNLAASEFVMPIGSLPAPDVIPPIEALMVQRRRYDVSAEAYLIRIAKVSNEPLAMFVSARGKSHQELKVEYSVSSSSWNLPEIEKVPTDSVLYQCSAIGQTLRCEEDWDGLGRIHVECVGIPGYPNSDSPRVAGIIRSGAGTSRLPAIEQLHGNVLKPSGIGSKLVCQLVNDRAPTWGGGVAREAAQRFPAAQRAYRDWFSAIPRGQRLGRAHIVSVEPELQLASLIAQEGFGESERPRIRYGALEKALRPVADAASQQQASVHMPRIGTGAAGGNWSTIEELVRDALVARGLQVVVYDPPPRREHHTLDLL